MVEDTTPSTSCCGNEEDEEDEEEEEEGGSCGREIFGGGPCLFTDMCIGPPIAGGRESVVWCALPGPTVHDFTHRWLVLSLRQGISERCSIGIGIVIVDQWAL